jgi:hypothetical protein
MKGINVETEALQTETVEIETLWVGECESLSGLSELTFAIGKHPMDSSLGLRIVSNSGSGMFSDAWIEGRRIDKAVIGKTELTAKSMCVLQPGKSINTGGFVLAALKRIGMVRVNEENSRLHGHVPTTTFEQVATAAMSGIDLVQSKSRKTLKLKKEEA